MLKRRAWEQTGPCWAKESLAERRRPTRPGSVLNGGENIVSAEVLGEQSARCFGEAGQNSQADLL